MYSKEHIEKIGNTIVFLASNMKNASKIKIINLLYILDEISIKKSGIPFLNLEYKVWRFGPVPSEIYVELSSIPVILKEHIERKSTIDGHDYISPKHEFIDDEFSENEIALLNFVVNEFNDKTVQQLVEYTHRKNSLWHQTASRNSVLELLEKDQLSMTDIVIDLSELISYDEKKLSLYKASRNSF